MVSSEYCYFLGSIRGESYQKLKELYRMPLCLTLSIIRHGSKVKWSNPGKGAAPPEHPGVVAIEKGAFGSLSTKVDNFTFIIFYSILLIRLHTVAWFQVLLCISNNSIKLHSFVYT